MLFRTKPMRKHSITASFAFKTKEEFKDLQEKFSKQSYDELIDAHDAHYLLVNETIIVRQKEDITVDLWD